jgi:hypothetical protein
VKIKIIKDFRFHTGLWIRKGEVVEARKTIGAMPLLRNYQLLDGDFSGEFVPETHCIELPDEPKRDDNLVILPVKVDEAIEYYSKPYTKYGVLNCILTENSQIALLARDALISRFGRDEWQDVLMIALVNGYTVETLESKIEDSVLKVVDQYSAKNEGYIDFEKNAEVARLITKAVTQVIREDGAAG